MALDTAMITQWSNWLAGIETQLVTAQAQQAALAVTNLTLNAQMAQLTAARDAAKITLILAAKGTVVLPPS